MNLFILCWVRNHYAICLHPTQHRPLFDNWGRQDLHRNHTDPKLHLGQDPVLSSNKKQMLKSEDKKKKSMRPLLTALLGLAYLQFTGFPELGVVYICQTFVPFPFQSILGFCCTKCPLANNSTRLLNLAWQKSPLFVCFEAVSCWF